MKKKIWIGAAIVLLILVAFFLFKPKSFEKNIEKVMEDLVTYQMVGEMELNKGEDIKSYLIEVYYKKGESDDSFRVTLFDKRLNQEQILLRNSEGVFVITPSLNQIYKFEGEWPLNSPKPYLLQTMMDVMHLEDTLIEKIDEGVLIKSKVNYPNNKNYKQQEMTFSKDGKPMSVSIYDDNSTIQCKILFSSVVYNEEIADSEFEVPQELNTTVSSTLTAEDLPLYPVSVFNADLVNTDTYLVNGNTRHVLEYAGDRQFTLVQTIKPVSEELEKVSMVGELVDGVDVIGFYDGVSMSSYVQNIEMTLYSSDLSVEEMIDVLSSLQVAVMK